MALREPPMEEEGVVLFMCTCRSILMRHAAMLVIA